MDPVSLSEHLSWYLISMHRLNWLFLVLILYFPSSVLGQDRARLEVPNQGETLIIEADRIVSSDKVLAEGNVVVTFQDIILRTGRLIYDQSIDL